MKGKTLAELQKLHDDLARQLAVIKQAIDTLKSEQRKPKRAKK